MCRGNFRAGQVFLLQNLLSLMSFKGDSLNKEDLAKYKLWLRRLQFLVLTIQR